MLSMVWKEAERYCLDAVGRPMNCMITAASEFTKLTTIISVETKAT